MDIEPHQIITCNIGIMNPNNGKFRNAQFIMPDKNKKLQTDTTFKIDKLARSV